jgi:uncharacterized membrane protein YgdD (TMEM256/DUF423 family)
MIRPPLVLAALAALAGAAGVALAAGAAHQRGGDLARTGALFLILHAAAGLGVASHARVAPVSSRNLLAAGFIMEAGAALFAADLATRAFAGERLFPFAAPDRRDGDHSLLDRAGDRLCGGGAALNFPSPIGWDTQVVVACRKRLG